MAQKITIIAKQVTAPTDSAYLFFGLDFGNTLGSYLNTSIFFITGDSDYPMGQVKYNHPTTTEFTQEIFNYFSYQFTNASVPFTYDIDLVFSTVTFYLGNNATVDYFNFGGNAYIDTDLWSLLREDYTFPVDPETITYEEKVILSRSPYFFKASPTVLYDTMKLDVYIYRGHKIDNRPIVPTNQLSKSVIQAGQPTVSVDIHKLVNDYVQNEFMQNVSLGVQTTSQFDSVWVYIDAGIYLDGVLKYSINQTLLALDGFGYHEELANPVLNKRVLSTINNHIVYNNSKYPLYFKSQNLAAILLNGTSIPFTLDANYNNQYIAYIDVTQTFAGGDFTITFFYEDEVITHNIILKNECRNNLINCIFKNKYGYWQKIPFNKLSKPSLNVESSDYNPFVSDFGSYSLNQHNTRSYLTNGKEKITCNTDFMPEEYNLLFKELMLSEQIYLEQGETILPVNLDTKTFTYKTKLKDKLIQYSMDFTYSFKTINNVV